LKIFNSAIVACTYTKFDAEDENGLPEPDLRSNFNYCKNQLIGDNLAIFEQIHTEIEVRDLFNSKIDIPENQSWWLLPY